MIHSSCCADAAALGIPIDERTKSIGSRQSPRQVSRFWGVVALKTETARGHRSKRVRLGQSKRYNGSLRQSSHGA